MGVYDDTTLHALAHAYLPLRADPFHSLCCLAAWPSNCSKLSTRHSRRLPAFILHSLSSAVLTVKAACLHSSLTVKCCTPGYSLSRLPAFILHSLSSAVLCSLFPGRCRGLLGGAGDAGERSTTEREREEE
eukprot:1691748-Rhodomonas_salina.1